MTIIPYTPNNRKIVEHIHFETGFLGKSMSRYLKNKNIYKQFITPYLNKEPQNIFLLEKDAKALGYALGSQQQTDSGIKFIVGTLKRALQGLFTKDAKYWFSQVFYLIDIANGDSEEKKFNTPQQAGHIHINLLPQARGKGEGTMLLKKLEQHLKAQGIDTLMANSYETKLNPNTNFWIKNGYTQYSKIKTTVFKSQLPKEEINLVCYVKKL